MPMIPAVPMAADLVYLGLDDRSAFHHRDAAMKLVPVLDLKEGQVVHAREGRRDHYAPLRSSLCEGAKPLVVVEALMRLFAFRTVYIADLDAIEKRGHHLRVLETIRSRFPDAELWVDSGISDLPALDRWLTTGLGVPVLGSESLADAEFVAAASTQCSPAVPILSLDFSGDAFRGPLELLADPARYWPDRILAMNIRRVGSGAGPDLELLLAIAARRTRPCAIYSAGGVRSMADLVQLQATGAAGALVATALHDGSLGPAQIASIAAQP